MIKCLKCGAEIDDNATVCPVCNAEVKSLADTLGEKAEQFTNTADFTSEYASSDIEENKIWALFSYLGLLFLIPLIAKPDSKYVRFHVNQGIVLFIAELVICLPLKLLSFIPFLGWIFAVIGYLVSLVVLAFAILGIVNAVTGKAKVLPIIGNIKIMK